MKGVRTCFIGELEGNSPLKVIVTRPFSVGVWACWLNDVAVYAWRKSMKDVTQLFTHVCRMFAVRQVPRAQHLPCRLCRTDSCGQHKFSHVLSSSS